MLGDINLEVNSKVIFKIVWLLEVEHVWDVDVLSPSKEDIFLIVKNIKKDVKLIREGITKKRRKRCFIPHRNRWGIHERMNN